MKRAKYCNRPASKGDAGVILTRISAAVLAVILAVISAGCAQGENAQQAENNLNNSAAQNSPQETEREIQADEQLNNENLVTQGTEEYRGFVVDNVYHSENDGDIHYSVYFPESYDANKQYALYITLPGYEGLYFQGVAQNLKSEEFAFDGEVMGWLFKRSY